MKVVFILLAILMGFTQRSFANLSTVSCESLLAGSLSPSLDSTDVYLNLLAALVKDKNSISASDLKIILSQKQIINPFKVIESALPTEQKYAFNLAFEKLLANQKEKPLDSAKISTTIEKWVEEKEIAEKDRGVARSETADLFAPIPVEEIKYKSGLGSISYAFSLPDKTVMTLFTDEGSYFLYDRQRKTETPLLWLINNKRSDHFLSQNGQTWLLFRDQNEPFESKLNVVEITAKHEISLIVKDYIMPSPNNIEFGNFRHYSAAYLKESANGKPAIIKELYHRGDSELTGYLEVEIESGKQKLIGIPPNPRHATVVKENGHVFTHFVDKNGQWIVSDLTDQKTLMKLTVPKVLEEFPTFTSIGPNGSLQIPIYIGKRPSVSRASQPPSQWIDVSSGKLFGFFDRKDQLSSPIVVISRGSEYQIINRSEHSDSVEVYNNSKDEMEVLRFPEQFFGEQSAVLNFKGAPILVVVSDMTKLKKTLLWLPLHGGETMTANLSNFDLTKFIRIWVTSDNRVEGLFDGDKGFKIVKLFGPVPKDGGAQ